MSFAWRWVERGSMAWHGVAKWGILVVRLGMQVLAVAAACSRILLPLLRTTLPTKIWTTTVPTATIPLATTLRAARAALTAAPPTVFKVHATFTFYRPYDSIYSSLYACCTIFILSPFIARQLEISRIILGKTCNNGITKPIYEFFHGILDWLEWCVDYFPLLCQSVVWHGNPRDVFTCMHRQIYIFLYVVNNMVCHNRLRWVAQQRVMLLLMGNLKIIFTIKMFILYL